MREGTGYVGMGTAMAAAARRRRRDAAPTAADLLLQEIRKRENQLVNLRRSLEILRAGEL